ncbi:MAG TPA: chemotaxis protein CheW [Anaerolineae bacterium]|nr:chemotaxis protein CheW [Anaerolineae bacterium]
MNAATRLSHDVDPDTAAVWARRAADLARVPATHDEGERTAFVVVRMGREMYAFGARYVFDIRPVGSIARVPRVPGWVAGVTAIRGRILSVLDLAAYFGLPPAETESEPGNKHLVLVETPAMELCLLVDEVVAVAPLPMAGLTKTGVSLHTLPPEYVHGLLPGSPGSPAPWGDGLLVVLDLPALLADRRIVVNQEVI